MKPILYTFTLFASIAFLASCSNNTKEAPAKLPSIEVTIGQVSGGVDHSFVSASGKIEAENSADISTRIMGYITSLNVKIGQKVSRGQLIATINSADLEAQKRQADAGIVQAQAALENAQKDYNRFKILFDKKSATQKELDDMTTRYHSSKAGLEVAKQMRNAISAQMDYTRITAPFSGEVTQAYVKAGDMANPGMSLVSIEGTGRLQAVVMVPESEIADIKPGMPVDINIKSLNEKIKGMVSEKSGSAHQTGGQYIVKVNLQDVPSNVLSGMFVDATFPIAATNHSGEDGQVMIPKTAVFEEGQLQGVYVVDSTKALLRWLQLGQTVGDQVQVLSGLQPGERYVLSSKGRLFNGATIKVQ